MAREDRDNSQVLRAVFDAMPALVFIVDDDVRIQEYNTAAAELISGEKATVILRRAGEVLQCVHSTETPHGCGGAPYCRNCVIRSSATAAMHGNHVVRRRTKMELVRNGDKNEIYALVTASPFVFVGSQLVLLVIEDIREIADFWRIIPVCSVCHKVRDDKESWMRVEAYFAEKWDVGFTHGYCPECLEAEMNKLSACTRHMVPGEADDTI
jgi:hypothetical protein